MDAVTHSDTVHHGDKDVVANAQLGSHGGQGVHADGLQAVALVQHTHQGVDDEG